MQRRSSPSASVGRQGKGQVPFISSFTRAEIRSVTNEELFEGEVLPITGRLSLARHSFEARGAGGALALISAFLVLASAVLFAFFPDQGWWNWCDQLLGRLATGAFGALLVDGAIDYSALRRSLLSGAGRVTNPAQILPVMGFDCVYLNGLGVSVSAWLGDCDIWIRRTRSLARYATMVRCSRDDLLRR
jgi:hypothetical protein